MLEYLDPVALPLLDSTVPFLRWRKVYQHFNLLGAIIHYDDFPIKLWQTLRLVAVSSKPDDYIRALSLDGQQFEFRHHTTAPGQLVTQDYWNLEAFTIPYESTYDEELASSQEL